MAKVLRRSQQILTNLGKARKYLIQARHWLNETKLHTQHSRDLHEEDMNSLIAEIDGLVSRYRVNTRYPLETEVKD